MVIHSAMSVSGMNTPRSPTSFSVPRAENRGERHAAGNALSPPPPLPVGDLHAQPPSQQLEPFNRPPTSPCNDSWGVRENSPPGGGSKSGSAQSPPPPFPLTSQLKSSRNCRRGDICFAGAGSSSSASRARFRRGEVQPSPLLLPLPPVLLPPPVHRRVASLKADNAVAFHQQIWGRGAPAEQSRSGRSTVMAPGGSWRHPLRRRRFLVFSRFTGSLSSGRSTTIPFAASIASGTTPPVRRRVASLKADNTVAFHQQRWGRGAPAEQSRFGRSTGRILRARAADVGTPSPGRAQEQYLDATAGAVTPGPAAWQQFLHRQRSKIRML